MENVHKFETRTLQELFAIRKEVFERSKEYDEDEVVKDKQAIDILIDKSRSCALEFAQTVNKYFIADYLNDNLEIGSLCHLSLSCSRTKPNFSRSHGIWLENLRRTKLVYDRGTTKQKNRDIERMWDAFQTLQKLAINEQ